MQQSRSRNSNQVLGDLAGNAARILDARRARRSAPARALVVTPELSLCGYPPEDLLLRPAFIDACARELAALAAQVTANAGRSSAFPSATDGQRHNALAVVARRPRGRGLSQAAACPTTRCSTSSAISRRAPRRASSTSTACRCGLIICEDVWFPAPAQQRARRARESRGRQRLALSHAAAGARGAST